MKKIKFIEKSVQKRMETKKKLNIIKKANLMNCKM